MPQGGMIGKFRQLQNLPQFSPLADNGQHTPNVGAEELSQHQQGEQLRQRVISPRVLVGIARQRRSAYFECFLGDRKQ